MYAEKDYVWNPSTCACEIIYAYMKGLNLCLCERSYWWCSTSIYDEIINRVAKLYNDTPDTVSIYSNHKMA